MKKLSLVCWFVVAGLPFSFLIHASEEQSASLEERVIELEVKALESKISWSGEYKDSFSFVNGRSTTANINKFNYRHHLGQLDLDLKGKVSSDITFYGRVTGGHNWNNNIMTPGVAINSVQNKTSSSFLWIDKSFISYNFKEYLNFALGRLPTQYGPPTHFYTDDHRLGTYPLLAYSLPFDGLATTFKINDLFNEDSKLYFRLIYSPFQNTGSGEITSPTASGASSLFRNNRTTTGESLFLNIEMLMNNLGLAKGMTFAVQATVTEFGRLKSINEVRGLLQTQMGSTVTDTNVYELGSDNHKLGRADTLSFYNDYSNIFGLPIDFYVVYKLSRYTKKGTIKGIIVEKNVTTSASVPLTALPAGYAIDAGSFIYKESASGSSLLAGLNFGPFGKMSFGYEYLRRSYGAIPSGVRTYSFTNFYTTIGHGHHGYINYNFTPKAKFLLGYHRMKREATFSAINYMSTDDTINQAYSLFIFRF